ncbi:MAG TPA: hypothetical protein VFU42_04295 [Candidatus Deferrimicrobiaceae bacterium]|nr:hypothetical protein [Candidatus Deferrimicrobiaceae bacterium]
MKRSKRFLPILLLAATGISGLAACATFPPPREAIPTSRVYGKGYNEVWDAVLAALSELNVEVKSMEKESGRIVAGDDDIELRQFEPGRYDSKYCFCGSPERYHFLRNLVAEYKISVNRVTEVRSSLNIEISYQASSYLGEVSAGWFPCVSKGVFESDFLERLDSRLMAGGSHGSATRNVDWWKPSRGY